MGLLAPIIDSLLDFIFPPRADELLVREAASGALAERTRPVLIGTTRPASIALLPFQDPLARAAIHETKYRGNARAETLLAEALAEYLRGFSDDSFERAVLIPMPLSDARRRERGFNQCETIAARALAQIGNADLSLESALLARVKDTEHQARLTRAKRASNIEGAFAAVRACDPILSYILFDDVITTGATMKSAVRALQDAGAKRILPLSLAYS